MTRIVAQACGRDFKGRAVERPSRRIIGEKDGRLVPIDQFTNTLDPKHRFTRSNCVNVGKLFAVALTQRFKRKAVYTWPMPTPSTVDVDDVCFRASNGIVVRGISFTGMWPPDYEFKTMVRFDILAGK